MFVGTTERLCRKFPGLTLSNGVDVPATRLWTTGIAYGGDYNPEQWPEATWHEDVALMSQAGVTLVTVGVFSWALTEPSPGQYEFGWLERVLDLLHGSGIAVDVATGTASPPPWFSRLFPSSLPQTKEGHRLWPGGRQAFCPSSPDYRDAATALAGALADRFGDHPALAMWHVHNEYGCHNAHCYCDESAASFRRWLRNRYGDLDRLNAAWGTAFWSQHYYDFEEIVPPRLTPTHANPTQQLDWWRFCSDELLGCFTAERDVLRAATPDVPITTNFMGAFKPLDYFAWGREQDIVSNDHYLIGEDPTGQVGLSMAADLTRSYGLGRPWILMEHSTSAVNWQPRNIAKAPGQLRRNSLAHVARGADAVCYFQWRASRAGAEKFHSAMLPHAGTDSKVWREVVELGSNLSALAEVAGSKVQADVGVVWDWSAWWAVELDSHPTSDIDFVQRIRDSYEALWLQGVTVDFVEPGTDLSGYRLVVVPSLYLVTDADAANLTDYVRDGGTLICHFFSGIVDPDDAIRLGGYPGAFRELLGVRIEEFFPLRATETHSLSDGSTASLWSELLRPEGAEVLSTYADGPLAGAPATTVHVLGAGRAHYISTRLDPAGLSTLLATVCEQAGVTAPADVPRGVEVVRRQSREGVSFVFIVNHTEQPSPVEVAGIELLTGRPVTSLVIAPGEVAVVKQQP
jgi:beta-galactosidase